MFSSYRNQSDDLQSNCEILKTSGERQFNAFDKCISGEYFSNIVLQNLRSVIWECILTEFLDSLMNFGETS